MAKMTLEEVLRTAISKEIAAQQLYADLAKKVTSPIAKETFQNIVHEERGHQLLLERYQRGEMMSGGLRAGQTIDYKIAESAEPTEITSDMPLKDIFIRAANREKVAYESYLALAKVHPTGEVRTLLEDLASQELTHKQKLEFLYTETAFPQTAGG